MTRPLAIDLCCGMGGWTNGLLAAGYDVIGFDITRFAEYRGRLVVQDVRTLVGRQFRRATLIVASSPCQEFSLHAMPMFHPNPPHPTLGIELFRACERIGEESGVPYILENVAGARRFVGPSVSHFGPFHLWGPGVPALLPTDRIVKGMRLPHTRDFAPDDPRRMSSGSAARREWSAKIAMIPEVLSRHVGAVWAPLAIP